jgi:hypothetical protein
MIGDVSEDRCIRREREVPAVAIRESCAPAGVAQDLVMAAQRIVETPVAGQGGSRFQVGRPRWHDEQRRPPPSLV